MNVTFAPRVNSSADWSFSLNQLILFEFHDIKNINANIRYECITKDGCDLDYINEVLPKFVYNYSNNYEQIYNTLLPKLYLEHSLSSNKSILCYKGDRSKNNSIVMCNDTCIVQTFNNLSYISSQSCERSSPKNHIFLIVDSSRALHDHGIPINTDIMSYTCNGNLCNDHDMVTYVANVIRDGYGLPAQATTTTSTATTTTTTTLFSRTTTSRSNHISAYFVHYIMASLLIQLCR
ncbi:unnamed protein product [Didymodactylos carnosus]|uniref:Uncharacterized protein n=1 Tax=Didymodactylos carnosus TaxID=1234261 RepID=A0A815E906_9BILA|nr:unnamed protein product [Didymodactylos carnosus]CAF1309311.1 unnamed protein product [Didymodactylos carnosus]CAF3616275.1 unnamed protein product [Didymodactylos carnosus]CAF4145418.1 unnamed protein product [Didymodactylos carnosus]